MTRPLDNDSAPGSAIVYIEARWGKTIATGTGFLVGRNDILTASHVVYDAALGGLADEVIVRVSYDPTATNAAPLTARVDYHFSTFDPDADGWLYAGDGRSESLGHSELDIALLSVPRAVGDEHGTFGLSSGWSGGAVRVGGHPGKYDRALVQDEGYAHRSATDAVFLLSPDLEINPGNSGGPIWRTTDDGRHLAVGVVSTKGWATAIDAHLDWIETAIAANDGGLPAATLALAGPFDNAATAVAILLEFVTGDVPTGDRVSELVRFVEAQVGSAAYAGTLNPWLGGYEALGLGLSETDAFRTRFGGSDDTSFVSATYEQAFARTASTVQIDHFLDQIAYFEALYGAAGISSETHAIWARGAVLGMILGHAAQERDLPQPPPDVMPMGLLQGLETNAALDLVA